MFESLSKRSRFTILANLGVKIQMIPPGRFSNTVLLLRSDFLKKNPIKNHHSVPKNVNNIGWYVPYDVAFYYIKKVEIFLIFNFKPPKC